MALADLKHLDGPETGLMKEGSGLLQGLCLGLALTWLSLYPTAKGCLMTHPSRLSD